MPSTNKYPGLARGPIDHKASSVINQVSNEAIDMGSVVNLQNSIISSMTLPKVINAAGSTIRLYGIAVGGDTDGVYGDGSNSVDDSTRATNGDGQGIVIVTQGRCLGRVSGSAGSIAVGDKLTSSSGGVLVKAVVGAFVIAIALNFVSASDTDMIAIDVQREGKFS